MFSPVARIVLKVLWASFLLVCLCLRFWINRNRFRTKWWITGDVCVTGAFILLVPTSGMLIYENMKYMEWYSTDEKDLLLHPLLRPDIRQIHFAMIYLYLSGMWLLKGAFIALYFDLFARQEGRKYRWCLYALAVWTAVAFVVLIFLCTFICTPISENWAIIPQCNVLTSKTTLYANYILNCSTDFFIFALPLFIVHSLKLDMRQKFGFVLVIVIGLVSICASTARFVEMYNFRIEFAKGSFRTLDKFGEMLLSIEDWSLAECWTALLAFCLPSFKVFLRRQRHSGMRMTSGSSPGVTVLTTDSHKFTSSWKSPALEETELGNFTEIRSVATQSNGNVSERPSLKNIYPNAIIAEQHFEYSVERIGR